MTRRDPIEACTGFDWDEDNAQKNWDRHQVMPEEAEQIFFREPLMLRSDVAHSRAEKRYTVLGHTDAERWLFAAFTIRENRIRIISVRDMNRKEREAYRRYEKVNS